MFGMDFGTWRITAWNHTEFVSVVTIRWHVDALKYSVPRVGQSEHVNHYSPSITLLTHFISFGRSFDGLFTI
jgi:hypothetical protein